MTRELTLGEMAKALQREADRVSALERHCRSLCATIGIPANQAETVARLAEVSERDIAAIVRVVDGPVSVPPEAARDDFKAHVVRVIGDAMGELKMVRDSSAGSMFEQFAAYAIWLRKLIGDAPEGSHPDEWLPRHATWHGERANWQGEVERLRAHAASQGEAEQGREGGRAEDIALVRRELDAMAHSNAYGPLREALTRILSALERAPRQEKGISAKARKAAMHVAAQRLLVHTDAISASDLDMVAEDVITAYQLALSGTHP